MTYRSLQRTLLWSILLAALLSPAVAGAQQPDASEHANKALKAYNLQDWATALKEYREAYASDARPEILWSIAQTQRLSGDCRGAILTYKAFARTASAAGANAAQDWIKKCDADLAAQAAAISATTQPATPPPPAPTAATPVAPPPAAPPPPPPPNHTWYADPLGDTLAILGVGGVATGAVFLAQFSSNSSAAKSAANDKASQAAWSTAQPQIVVGGVAMGVGGALLLGAIWRYVVVAGRGQEKSPAAPPVAFSVAPNAVQLSYGVQF